MSKTKTVVNPIAFFCSVKCRWHKRAINCRHISKIRLNGRIFVCETDIYKGAAENQVRIDEVRQILKAMHVTHIQIAEKFGVHVGTFQGWLYGHNFPVERLEQLRQIYKEHKEN